MNKMECANNAALSPIIIALNYFSLVFIVTGITLAFVVATTTGFAYLYFILWLYLVPPLLCRLFISVFGRPSGIVTNNSRTLTHWWLLMQLQLVYNRLPFLEELLRLIPGVYAVWLNLWGANVSIFAYWSPGATVMDRYHLHIEKGVTLGRECFISAHVMKTWKNGGTLLVVDRVTVETGATVGVRSKLGPGCHIHAFETIPANGLIKPYTEIKAGKKKQLRSIGKYLRANSIANQ